jgi:hypothetical protein
MLNFLLFITAWVLVLPLTIINFFAVKSKDYFRDTALNLDKFGNREFRTLFNKVLITKKGFQFGDHNETISSVLGKNQINKTLTKTGVILAKILDTLDKNHCKNSIKWNK